MAKEIQLDLTPAMQRLKDLKAEITEVQERLGTKQKAARSLESFIELGDRVIRLEAKIETLTEMLDEERDFFIQAHADGQQHMVGRTGRFHWRDAEAAYQKKYGGKAPSKPLPFLE